MILVLLKYTVSCQLVTESYKHSLSLFLVKLFLELLAHIDKELVSFLDNVIFDLVEFNIDLISFLLGYSKLLLSIVYPLFNPIPKHI